MPKAKANNSDKANIFFNIRTPLICLWLDIVFF